MINADDVLDSSKKQAVFEYLALTDPEKVKSEQENVRRLINWPQELTKTDMKRILSNEGTKFIRLIPSDDIVIAIQPLTGVWKERADKVKNLRQMTTFFEDILALNLPAFVRYQEDKRANPKDQNVYNRYVYPYSAGVPIMAYYYVIRCMRHRWIVNNMCNTWFVNMEEDAREQIATDECRDCTDNHFTQQTVNGYDTVMTYLSDSVYQYALYFSYDRSITSRKYLPIPAIVSLGGTESPMLNIVKVADIEKHVEWFDGDHQARIIKK